MSPFVLSGKKSPQVVRLPTEQHIHAELELHENKNV